MADFYKINMVRLQAKYAKGPFHPYWQSSPIVALRDCFPRNTSGTSGTITKIPERFWESRGNRRKYMRWLADQLGYTAIDDWYRIACKDFRRTGATTLLRKYQSCPARIVMDLVPRKDWCEWRFAKVPVGFWDSPANRHRYLRWLGRELGFRDASDWYRLTSADLYDHHGGALFDRFRSLRNLMRDFLPNCNWDYLGKRSAD